ncbi:MAG: dephospho-CoA kinase [Flavobacteriales bacterium]|nr:dephospho-CoA kinase [Flavobacteriales bacterium]
MFTVGLTGGIGSGKTTVAKVFRVLGIPVFDADRAGHRLLAEDRSVIEAIAKRFGNEVLGAQGIDRQALARLVFHDHDALQALSAIVHPAVRQAFRNWAELQRSVYVVMEAAVLVESGGHASLDRLLVVNAPEELRIQRTVKRDGTSREAVLARMRNQATDGIRLAAAHWVIDNNDSDLVIPQVVAVHEALVKAAQ